MAKGPQYSDSTDVIRLLRVATWFGPACFVMLSGLWYFMWDKGWISDGVFVFLLLLNVPITIGGIFVIHRAVGEPSVLLVKTIFAARVRKRVIMASRTGTFRHHRRTHARTC